MNVHMNAAHTKVVNNNQVDGEISLEFLRRFIQFCRRYKKIFKFFMVFNSNLNMLK
jgi:hypothetical protein